ncbi:AcrB/AcrD/AcrF family protein [bacterium]|nr:AcrB/AcrD/AcrF family protein [bacterium]
MTSVDPRARSFFGFFVRHHMLANLFTLMVLLLGVATLLRIQRDIFPEVDLGRVVITTRYPGASPRDVELNVTNEIEDEVATVAGLDRIVSYSLENLSVVTVHIDIDAPDRRETEQEILRAVDRVTDLPPEVDEEPRVEVLEGEDLPVVEVGVAGDLPYEVLREAARRFERRLEDVPGVAELEDHWLLDREVRVAVDPEAMRRDQVALAEIADAVRRRNVRATGGELESYRSEEAVVLLSEFPDPESVARVPVRSTFEGPIVRVGDVATIEDGFEDPRVITRIGGVPAITFAVLKLGDADIIETVGRIHRLADDFADELPEGASIAFTNDSSYYVSNRFDVVLANGAIGLGVVLVILGAFLNLRTAFWVAVSIPVVLLGVVFLLPATGHYLDIITLAAMLLVLGIIVDDGIIVAENSVRHRRDGADPNEAAAAGVAEVFRPVATTILTTVLAFAPMFFMPGLTGQFVQVVPLVITLAMLLSAFELVVALPAHLAGSLRRQGPGARAARSWFDPLRRGFERGLRALIGIRYAVIAGFTAVLAGTLWYAAVHMPFILFPGEAADTFTAYVSLPVGSSLQRTSDRTAEIEALIAELPADELQSYATRVGSHGQHEPGTNDHWSMVRVNLVPYAQRDRTAAEIVAALAARTDRLEGFEDILYRIDEGGPPVGRPVTIRVVGHDPDRRRALADSVVAFLGSIDGVHDLDRSDRVGPIQLRLELDHDALARLGLTVAQIARTLRIAYDGLEVTDVRWGREDVDVRVQLAGSARRDTTHLRELRVANARGRLIRLGDVATLVPRSGPSRVYHHDTDRATMITSDVDEDLVTPVQVTGRVLDHFDLEERWPGMRFVVGGEAEETQESFESLFVAFGAAVVGIYFLLILLFDSVTRPLLVLAAIPGSIVAVILVFALHGLVPGFLAVMGLVGLSGVVVNDSLVMIAHIDRLRAAEPEADIASVVAAGAADRFRPIVMTTLTTAGGLVPLAYGIGGSDPFLAPMALALGMGMLLSTPQILLMVPCLYLARDDVSRLVRRLRGRSRRA